MKQIKNPNIAINQHINSSEPGKVIVLLEQTEELLYALALRPVRSFPNGPLSIQKWGVEIIMVLLHDQKPLKKIAFDKIVRSSPRMSTKRH